MGEREGVKRGGSRRVPGAVLSILGPLCEGAPPAGGGGENCTAVRNISNYGKVLSLRPFGAPLPFWRKRRLPRIGGSPFHRGRFFDTLIYIRDRGFLAILKDCRAATESFPLNLSLFLELFHKNRGCKFVHQADFAINRKND